MAHESTPLPDQTALALAAMADAIKHDPADDDWVVWITPSDAAARALRGAQGAGFRLTLMTHHCERAPERVTLQVCPRCGRATYHRSQKVCNCHPFSVDYTEVVNVEYVRVLRTPDEKGRSDGT